MSAQGNQIRLMLIHIFQDDRSRRADFVVSFALNTFRLKPFRDALQIIGCVWQRSFIASRPLYAEHVRIRVTIRMEQHDFRVHPESKRGYISQCGF